MAHYEAIHRLVIRRVTGKLARMASTSAVVSYFENECAALVIQDKHSTFIVHPPHPARACASIHPEGKLCSDIGRAVVLNNPGNDHGRGVIENKHLADIDAVRAQVTRRITRRWIST